MENEERINNLIDTVYDGARWNPGKEKRTIVSRKRATVLDINVCQQPGCECGWNIQIGSKDYKLLSQILDLIDNKISAKIRNL